MSDRHSWQPIETAPKDQYAILLSDGKEVIAGRVEDGGAICFAYVCGYCSAEFSATHWMPMPSPPDAGTPA